MRSERCVRNPGLVLRAATPERHLAADHLQRLLRQRRVQLVVGEQLHAALEVLGQRLHREVRARMLAGADVIERLLECDPIEMLAAVGEQPLEHLRDAFLAGSSSVSGRLRMCPNTLTVSLTSAVCTMSERPFGSVLTTGCSVDAGTSQALQCLARPRRQGSRMRLAERDRFPPAESAAVRGHRRPEPRGSMMPVTA